MNTHVSFDNVAPPVVDRRCRPGSRHSLAAWTRRRKRLLARLIACSACWSSLCLTAQEPQLTTVWQRDFNGDGLIEVSRIEGTWIEYVG